MKKTEETRFRDVLKSMTLKDWAEGIIFFVIILATVYGLLFTKLLFK